MNRREFLAASAVAGVAPLSQIEALEAQQGTPRQYIELRRYHLIPGSSSRDFGTFMGDVAVPAMTRAGVGPIGAFTVVYGENAPSLLLLLTHKTLESAVTLRDRLAADAEYNRAGASVLEAPLSNPPFLRVESKLMRAFEAMPTVEVPATSAAKSPRIFELRTYESHSDRAALSKLRMFNSGEVPIFRRTGLTPVFFGETLIGDKMPSLNYMLTFADMAERDRSWAAFSADPEWRTMSADPQWRENTSAISDIILRPTAYSQL